MSLPLFNGGRAANIAGGFTANEVTLGGSAYLDTNTTAIGTDSKESLIFWSGTVDASGREWIFGMDDGTYDHYLALYDISTKKLRWRVFDSALNSRTINGTTDLVTNAGERINILASADLAVPDLKLYLWATTSTSGSWTSEGSNGAGATTDDIVWSIPAGIFSKSEAGGSVLTGSTYRLAVWTAPSGGVPDISSSTVQDYFSDSSTGALVDPATSVAQYGTPEIDVYGTASDYNSGVNNGSLGTLDVNGTFS